jgi:hypothetical protein
MESKLERRKRDADQEIHRVVQRQLEELRVELDERTERLARLQQASSVSGSAVLLAQRVKQLEETVKARDLEIQELRSSPISGGTAAAATAASTSPAAPMPEMRVPEMVASSSAAVAALEAESAQLSALLREWERGMLQEELSSAADRALRASTPAVVSEAADKGKWSAGDAAEAVRGLARQASALREALSVKDAKILELSAVGSGAEVRCAALHSRLQRLEAELQAAVTADKAARRQLAAVILERDALRRALEAPVTASRPETVSGMLELAQRAAAAAELQVPPRFSPTLPPSDEMLLVTRPLPMRLADTCKRQCSQVLVTGLQSELLGLRREADSAAAAEAAAKVEAAAAKARAEAAEARCAQLEKEADGLALDVATLQVGQGGPRRD